MWGHARQLTLLPDNPDGFWWQVTSLWSIYLLWKWSRQWLHWNDFTTAYLSLSVLIQIRQQICAWRRGWTSLNKYFEISHRFWQLVKINKTLISFLFTRLKVKVNFIIPKWQLTSQAAVYENKKERHTDTHNKKKQGWTRVTWCSEGGQGKSGQKNFSGCLFYTLAAQIGAQMAVACTLHNRCECGQPGLVCAPFVALTPDRRPRSFRFIPMHNITIFPSRFFFFQGREVKEKVKTATLNLVSIQ